MYVCEYASIFLPYNSCTYYIHLPTFHASMHPFFSLLINIAAGIEWHSMAANASKYCLHACTYVCTYGD